MTAALRCLHFLAAVLLVAIWNARAWADNDVTVVAPSGAVANPAPQKAAVADGTPVVHKSLHKKKHKAVASSTQTVSPSSSASSTTTASPTKPATTVSTAKSAPTLPAPTTPPSHPQVTQTSTTSAPSQASTDPAPAASPTAANPPSSSGPAVETGLPVARYPSIGKPIGVISPLIPPTVAAQPALTTTHHPYFASLSPTSILPGGYSQTTDSSSVRTPSPSSDFVFTNFTRHSKVTYPWKTGIITTMFWIGEGGSSISSTDNVGSAWDENWRQSNRGSDNPYDRNGYSPADHAPTVNPFYVALPFNDLAFPEKARQWLPAGWYRRPENGKQVSACKDRWVEIKNTQGHICYAQWEDVGPLRYDHAEYVFGSERPDTYTRAGLDVSPAVAQYLGIDGNRRAITSWRFVDDEDVPPGQWLKYDEQAVIFAALHQLKSFHASPDLPIQRATEPINDPENIDSNKKKVDASKG